jgi:GNAT superfamily N-acetyltransferase
MDFSTYAADEVLEDGGRVHIRAIRPDDKQRLQNALKRLSPDTIYYRFFGVKRELTVEELRRFTELDFNSHVGLVAIIQDEGPDQGAGVVRYIESQHDGLQRRADVSIVVADEHQGRGIGTLLLIHLVKIARANSIAVLQADILGENNRMLNIVSKSGLPKQAETHNGVVHLLLSTERA